MSDQGPRGSRTAREAIENVLDTLSYREREIIKLRYGIGDGYTYTAYEVGLIFKLSADRIRQIEAKAIRKLQHPVRTRRMAKTLEQIKDLAGQDGTLPASGLRLVGDLADAVRELELRNDAGESIEVRESLEQVAELSVDLIIHLKGKAEDFIKLPWQVFEELVAECLASRGFESVRLVGREQTTAADIFAVEHSLPSDTKLRYFIEVKRWKDKVGVEVIDRVLGAMTSERSSWGWHLAMIVAPLGFKSFRKFSREKLRMMGVELRDKDDIVRWLKEYRPADKGLWLPKGFELESAAVSHTILKPVEQKDE